MQGTAAISEDTGYQISKSIRIDPGSNPRLKRTPSTDGNGRTFTFAAWVKKSKTCHEIFAAPGTGDAYFVIGFDTNDRMHIAVGNGTDTNVTNRVFRDPSAWFHVVVAVDTDQTVQSDKLKIYINGEKETSFNASPAFIANVKFGVSQSNVIHYIGGDVGNSDDHDGYLADVQLIDGLQLPAAAFGEFSKGVWNPKTFARPAPNTNKTWSNDVTTDTGSFRGGHPATVLFDGGTGTTCQSSSDSNGNWIKFTPTGGIPFSSIEVKQNGSTQVEYVVTLNDNTEYSERHASNGWHTVAAGISGTLKSLQVIMRGAAEYSETSAIKIDSTQII